MIKTLVVIATVASVVSTPAFASDRTWQVGNDSFHVYYSDLDMNSTAGRATLVARVDRAADRLCRDNHDVHCRGDAIAQVAANSAPVRLALADRGATAIAATR